MPLQQGEVQGYDFNRSVVEFTMLNQGKVILCAISTAAMTDRQSQLECLLTNCTHRSFHHLGNLFYWRLGFRMCLQVAMILRSPRLELTAFRYFLSHVDGPRF